MKSTGFTWRNEERRGPDAIVKAAATGLSSCRRRPLSCSLSVSGTHYPRGASGGGWRRSRRLLTVPTMERVRAAQPARRGSSRRCDGRGVAVSICGCLPRAERALHSTSAIRRGHARCSVCPAACPVDRGLSLGSGDCGGWVQSMMLRRMVSSREARSENMIIPRHPARPPSGRTSRLRPNLTSVCRLSCTGLGQTSRDGIRDAECGGVPAPHHRRGRPGRAAARSPCPSRSSSSAHPDTPCARSPTADCGHAHASPGIGLVRTVRRPSSQRRPV